jgi:hypothetical protein
VAAPLVSADELNDHMQTTVAPATAELAVAGASGAVRAYCMWNISREATTFHAVGDGSPLLTLPTLLLESVSQVRISGTAIAVTAPQPRVLRHGQLVYDLWPSGELIEVDVVHGYDPAPDVVRLVALTVAARIVNNPDNFKTAASGSISRSYDPGLCALDERLLAPFRLE